MAKFFDHKVFNEEAFGKYMSQIPNNFTGRLLKSGVLRQDSQLKSLLSTQTGSHYAVRPMFDKLRGTYVNYDGSTTITDNGQKTFHQGVIAFGRATSFKEKDFSDDITGEAFMKVIGGQINEYWEEVFEAELLAVLEGIFADSSEDSSEDNAKKEFIKLHTSDISRTGKATDQVVNATTLNNAIQKASGDKKSNFKLVVMHSQVATNLENLKLLDYYKYNDGNGIERDLTLATWNGKEVIITDDGTTTGDDKFITYVLGKGAIDFAQLDVKVPYEMVRDAKTNGGETSLITRKRLVYAPVGLSYKEKTKISPLSTDLKNGVNWTVVNDGEGTEVINAYPLKSIPIARIISKG